MARAPFHHAETQEERIERRRANWRAYARTPRGRQATRRRDAKKYDKVRGPKGVDFRRRLMLKHRYGITPEEYEKLLAKQHGHCALCSKTPDTQRYGKLHVDHDHNTGAVRGLLCMTHNQAIGKLGDTAAHIRAVLRYLGG
jgi:hypothetical protein